MKVMNYGCVQGVALLSCASEVGRRPHLEACVHCDEGVRHGASVCEVGEADAGGRRPQSSMQCEQRHAGPSGEACSNAGKCPVTLTVVLKCMRQPIQRSPEGAIALRVRAHSVVGVLLQDVRRSRIPEL